MIFINQNSPTDIKNDAGDLIPDKLVLYQNYPNPFNPTTHIKYGLNTEAFVRLDVFDILGKKVAELVSEHQSPGNYLVNFDGSKFSSGQYFYALSVDQASFVKKMVVIK